MIIIKTIVRATDTTGARLCECIKILRSKYYNGKLTDYIIIAVKTALTNRKIKRHEVYKGIVVRIKKKTMRFHGGKITFEDNGIVLFNKRNEIFASRVLGPVCTELRKEKIVKILTMSGVII
uniref:Ribosomal protein L14 n=1 Tax=Acrasis kona TaxID=1008807 RepID=A0A0B4MZG3_9EUKA|nr:ribosomal protein L14 [Acrasis kona]AID52046.1 ribosomal protein L14 [Acrasis kona]